MRVFDKIIDTTCRFEVPEVLEIEGLPPIRVWGRGKNYAKSGMRKKTLMGEWAKKRLFWKEYRVTHPKAYERYIKAGQWITPEEAEKVYG